jgi:hypothetical protein
MTEVPFVHAEPFQSHRAAMSFITANYPPNTVTLEPVQSGDNVNWRIVPLGETPPLLDWTKTEELTFSSKDLHNMQRHLARAPDPAEALKQLMAEKIDEKAVQEAQRRMERMTKDAARISATDRWWDKRQLFVKSQPWITESTGQMRSGVIAPHDILTVAVNGNGLTLEKFDTIEDLVKIWSVD